LMRLGSFLEKCSFPKIDTSPDKLQHALELSSPERMRALEKQQSANWVLTKNTRADKPFVRSAKAGGWRSTLSPKSIADIESAWGPLMEKLGYELVSHSKTQAVRSSHD